MKVTSDDLKSLDPDDFERLIAHLLVAYGLQNVRRLIGGGEEGIDLRAEWLEDLPTGDSRMTLWAIQCKRYTRSLSQKDITNS